MCVGALVVIGSRKRGLVNISGESETLIIRRLRCEGCRKIHHELPDIVMPYKRHCADTIERIIDGDDEEVVCEDSTICRIIAWWTASLLYFESILESLEYKYGTKISLKSAPRKIVRAVINAHLWVHTRTAFMPV